MTEIEKHPAVIQDRLNVNQNIDQGGAPHNLSGVKGPLITLQENRATHLAWRIKVGPKKLPLIALSIRPGAEETGDGLHVASRHIPAKRGR